MGKVDVDFDEAADKVTTAISEGSSKLTADFDANLLQQLIEGLLEIREKMKDRIPMEPPALGESLKGVNEPPWIVNLASLATTGESKPQIVFRHPGLGWRSVYLSPGAARNMAEALTAVAQMADKKGVTLQ